MTRIFHINTFLIKYYFSVMRIEMSRQEAENYSLGEVYFLQILLKKLYERKGMNESHRGNVRYRNSLWV